ncbi:MAG: 2-oxo-4-hydroxy-4-carboxy-5-ureidoimidazoline decarboxylase [Bacteroidota bacterium]
MTLESLNNLDSDSLFAELFKCCGSTSWAKKLAQKKPFLSLEDIFQKSDLIWAESNKEDGLEAFTHHPKIGDVSELEKKFASTKEWAGGEQAGVNVANKTVLEALAKGNTDYEAKFSYIFIVCATGKSAEEMLALLNARIGNDAETEFSIAMGEQNKITKIRLEKLLNS